MLATDEYETPRWAMLGLGVGFVLLAIVGILTVLIPELEDEPDEAADRNFAGPAETQDGAQE